MITQTFSALAIMGLLLGTIFLFPAQAGPRQLVATAQQICCKSCRSNIGPIKTADLVTVTFRNLGITAGPGSAGVFLPLPGNVATVDGGVIIQDGKTLVLTDVRITRKANRTVELDLREQSQTLAVNRLLLTETSMEDGWQSVTGVSFTGDETIGVGVAIAKASAGEPTPVIDIELIGYVTTR
jgi:hypothetical protein